MIPMIAKPAHLHIVGGAAQDGEDALDQVFAALADPVRRSILSRLDGQERSAAENRRIFCVCC